jgi:hypothetical protein
MAVANTLAYYIMATIAAVKSFIVQAPGALATSYRSLPEWSPLKYSPVMEARFLALPAPSLAPTWLLVP